MHILYYILYLISFIYYILYALYYMYNLSYMGPPRNVRFKFVMFTQLSYHKQLQGYRYWLLIEITIEIIPISWDMGLILDPDFGLVNLQGEAPLSWELSWLTYHLVNVWVCGEYKYSIHGIYKPTNITGGGLTFHVWILFVITCVFQLVMLFKCWC